MHITRIEDAISPLWKGSRFPMSVCIGGSAMLSRQHAVIEDDLQPTRALPPRPTGRRS